MPKSKYRIHEDGEVWHSGRSIWHCCLNGSQKKELIKIGIIKGKQLLLDQHLVRFLPEPEFVRSVFDFCVSKGLTEVACHDWSWCKMVVVPRLNKKLKLLCELPI